MSFSIESHNQKCYIVINEILNNPKIKFPELASKIQCEKEDLFSILDFIDKSDYLSGMNFSRGKGNEILIPFYDNAQITEKGIQFIDCYKKEHEIKNQKVFISYNQNSCKGFIDVLEDELRDYSLVSRDINEVGYWDSFKEFMDSIREHDLIIAVISDRYLKSANCMYEIIEMMKDNSWKNKLLTIVWDDVKIYNASDRLTYTEFWNNEYKELSVRIKSIPPEDSIKASEDLRRISTIKSDIGIFLDYISDTNNPNKYTGINAVKERLNRLGRNPSSRTL